MPEKGTIILHLIIAICLACLGMGSGAGDLNRKISTLKK